MSEIQNDTPSSDSTLTFQSLGYETDGDEDLHCCGKCKLFFNSLQDYLEHKVKHDKCKVKYTRSKYRRLIIPNVIDYVDKKRIEVPDLSKVKSEAADQQEEEKENNAVKRRRGKRKKISEVDQELVIKEKAVYICSKCDKKFNREATLKRHTEIDHNSDDDDDDDGESDPNDDDINDEDFVSAKRFRINSEDKGDRPYTCEVCGNKFKEVNVLRNHLLTHSNLREFCCTFEGCTFAFKTKGSLKRHMRRHTGERPYPCELCGRCFTEAGALTRHMKARKSCTSKTDADFPRYGKRLDLTTNMPVYDNALSVHAISEEPDGVVDIITGTVVTVSMDDEQIDGAQLEPGEVITDGEEVGLEGVIEGVSIDFPDPVLEEEYAILTPTQCRVCREEFQSVDSLRVHLRVHLADTPFRCGLCHFITEKRDILAQHMLSQHQAQLKGNEGTVELSRTSAHVNSPDKEHQIRNAQIAVKQLLDLPLHPQEFEPEIQGPKVYYKCPVCLRSFSGSSYLRIHMRSHTGDRPFKCPHCEKSFVSKDTLEKHIYVHTDERQFKCGECGKLFKRIAHVREHLKTHSGDRPFPCSLCDKAFKTTNALKVHLRTHSSILPYECQFCHRHFRERGSLQRHERMHTGERPYRCKHCDKTFAEHGTLNRHLKAKVPCTSQLQQARQEEQKEAEYPTVLAEFSSVVADTQYILPEEEEAVLEEGEQPAEYVVVETDNFDAESIQNVEIITEGEVDSSLLETIGVSGDSEAYVVISEDGESMQIVDPKTGEIIATMPVTTISNEENNTQTVAVIPVNDGTETVVMTPDDSDSMASSSSAVVQTIDNENMTTENLETICDLQTENQIEAVAMAPISVTDALAQAMASSDVTEEQDDLLDKAENELVSSDMLVMKIIN